MKTKNRLKHLEKEEVPKEMTNKNSSNMTDIQMKTLQPEGQDPLKNAKPQTLRKANKKRGEKGKGT